MTGCSLTDKEVSVLADIVAKSESIELVDLRNNEITEAGAIELAKTLSQNKSLLTLNLSGNKIGDEGAAALALALAQHTKLEHLPLDDISLTDAGMAQVCKGLVAAVEKKGKTGLSVLRLSKNNIKCEGTSHVASVLSKDANISGLDLSHNGIGDEGAKALADAIETKKTGIVSLDLSYNSVSSKGVEHLSKSVKATAGEGSLEIDLCENKLIGRNGLASLMDADFALSFPLLKVLRAE